MASEDDDGRKARASYMLRTPLALQKMNYDAATGTVLYRWKMRAGLKRKCQLTSGAKRLPLPASTLPIATSN